MAAVDDRVAVTRSSSGPNWLCSAWPAEALRDRLVAVVAGRGSACGASWEAPRIEVPDVADVAVDVDTPVELEVARRRADEPKSDLPLARWGPGREVAARHAVELEAVLVGVVHSVAAGVDSVTSATSDPTRPATSPSDGSLRSSGREHVVGDVDDDRVVGRSSSPSGPTRQPCPLDRPLRVSVASTSRSVLSRDSRCFCWAPLSWHSRPWIDRW